MYAQRWIVTIFCLGLLACGGPSLQVQEISPTENPSQRIQGLDSRIQKARVNQVNDLSPAWFSKAERSLRGAKAGQKRGSSINRIFKAVALGEAQIKRAERSAKVAREQFSNVITARQDAQLAGAPSLGSDYSKTEEEFKEMMSEVEEGDVNGAKSYQRDLLGTYRALEVRAIKKQALMEARRLIQKAVSIGTEQVAPKSLLVARTKLRDTERFIAANPREKTEIRERAAEAVFFANRLIHITNESILTQQRSSEGNTVRMENMLLEMSKSLEAPDMRDQALGTQVDNIKGYIAQLRMDRDFLSARVDSMQKEAGNLKNQIAKLEGITKAEQSARAKMAAEQEFQKKYARVRRLFPPREAEVYKQDERLLVRLRAMSFPVGQSVVLPDNYDLLSKVQRAIRIFETPKVMIEGHTDSTGSEAINNRLSQLRAEAVKKYLVANKTLSNEKISAVGFGSSRPLASNKSRRGRAMNRRIDVVIEPLR